MNCRFNSTRPQNCFWELWRQRYPVYQNIQNKIHKKNPEINSGITIYWLHFRRIYIRNGVTLCHARKKKYHSQTFLMNIHKHPFFRDSFFIHNDCKYRVVSKQIQGHMQSAILENSIRCGTIEKKIYKPFHVLNFLLKNGEKKKYIFKIII